MIGSDDGVCDGGVNSDVLSHLVEAARADLLGEWLANPGMSFRVSITVPTEPKHTMAISSYNMASRGGAN
jgi:hypothetical protein